MEALAVAPNADDAWRFTQRGDAFTRRGTTIDAKWRGVQTRGVMAGRVLVHKLVDRVLRGTMAWFDTTPSGRVLNRFSRDTDMLDTQACAPPLTLPPLIPPSPSPLGKPAQWICSCLPLQC